MSNRWSFARIFSVLWSGIDGVRKVLSGATTIREVLKAVKSAEGVDQVSEVV